MKKKRTRQLDQIRRDISGGDDKSQQAQLSSELKQLSPTTKQTVCADAGVHSKTKFGSEEGLHIKNAVGLTWCQMRLLTETLSVRGVKFQSEHKERIYRTASLRDHFEVDSVDLLVQDEKINQTWQSKALLLARLNN